MRGSGWGWLIATASLAVACANGGVGVDDGQPGLAPVGDGGAGQAARGQDAGGGSSGSTSSSSSGGGPSDSGPGDDASPGDDGGSSSNGGSADSGSSSGGSDASTGSSYCGSNALYYVEALSAYTGGGATLCLNGSGCPAGDCCFQAVQQLPVDVCIKQ